VKAVMVCLGLILVLCVCVCVCVCVYMRVCEVCGVSVAVVILQQDHTYASVWVRMSKSEVAGLSTLACWHKRLYCGFEMGVRHIFTLVTELTTVIWSEAVQCNLGVLLSTVVPAHARKAWVWRYNSTYSDPRH